MSYRIGVDIGGTFTDCLVVADDGRRRLAKALSTHDGLIEGVLSALRTNAEQFGVDLHELLSETTSFVHGTTVATNAILTRNGSRTGLITTRGFEDTLPIGKVFSKRAGLSERDIVHASRLRKPEPIVARHLIEGLSERIDRDGDVIVAINEDEVEATVGRLLAGGVEAIAVCLMWSFVNPEHELIVKRVLERVAPGKVAAYSHVVAPTLGEYERTATTVLNAYIAPKVTAYIQALGERLAEEGLGQPLLVMQSNGGLTSVAGAHRLPLLTLDSGPVGGVLGCRYLGELYGEDDLICTDVGGTSFDVGLVLDGEVILDHEPIVSQHTLALPKVAVASIGSGGGSVAWIDRGGLLRVGPQSAGSDPGPVCYGRGGLEPTVTDADVALGYLDPEAFLGGRMPLDRDAALGALAKLGQPLGMEAEQVALGVFRIVNSQMADLIRRVTIEQGHDPRGALLVAYGGAAPTHAAFYGTDIGAKAILIPADSTVFSAEGMLTCDLVRTAQLSRVLHSPFDAEDEALVAREFDALQSQILAEFGRDGVADDDVEVRRIVGVRYQRQVHTIEVTLGAGQLDGVRAQFEASYGKMFGDGSVAAGGPLELHVLRLVATRRMPPLGLVAETTDDEDPTAAWRGTRTTFTSAGSVNSALFDGDALAAGNRVEGPAVIQRMGDSVVVPDGFTAEVDPYLAIWLRPASPQNLALAGAQAEERA
jgi:N-methylhydantoinase A